MTFKTAGWAAAISGVAGYIWTVDPNTLVQNMSVVAQNQIAQAGFFFTLAAWIHSGRVKKEIKDSFSSLTEALNSLSDALRKELKIHTDQLSDHAIKLDKLKEHVQELQGKTTQGEPNVGH